MARGQRHLPRLAGIFQHRGRNRRPGRWHRKAAQIAGVNVGNLLKPSRAARVQGARSTGTGVYMQVHEDSEHRATQQSGRTAGFERFPYPCAMTESYRLHFRTASEIGRATSELQTLMRL